MSASAILTALELQELIARQQAALRPVSLQPGILPVQTLTSGRRFIVTTELSNRAYPVESKNAELVATSRRTDEIR